MGSASALEPSRCDLPAPESASTASPNSSGTPPAWGIPCRFHFQLASHAHGASRPRRGIGTAPPHLLFGCGTRWWRRRSAGVTPPAVGLLAGIDPNRSSRQAETDSPRVRVVASLVLPLDRAFAARGGASPEVDGHANDGQRRPAQRCRVYRSCWRRCLVPPINLSLAHAQLRSGPSVHARQDASQACEGHPARVPGRHDGLSAAPPTRSLASAGDRRVRDEADHSVAGFARRSSCHVVGW
jgi:hypothetical protein